MMRTKALTFLGGAALTLDLLGGAGPAFADASVPAPATNPAPMTVPAAVAATTPADPALSIAIDDGRTTTAPGETNSYTVHLRNTGTADRHALALMESLPNGLTLVASTPTAKAVGHRVGWTVDVPSGQEIAVHADVKIGPLPARARRLSSVACVAESETSAPLICATHSDLLPAGVAAEAKAVRSVATAGHAAGSSWSWTRDGAFVLALVTAAGVGVLLARRRPSRASGRTGKD